MRDTDSSNTGASKTRRTGTLPWKRWAAIVAALCVAYFANVEVQSYLGRKALDATGMNPLPLQQAMANAARENKLVLANMSAIWCATCRKLDNLVFSNPSVRQAIERDYVFARIEYESAEGEAFMEKYHVRGFPTLLVLDSQGTKLRQLPLTFEPGGFIALLEPKLPEPKLPEP